MSILHHEPTDDETAAMINERADMVEQAQNTNNQHSGPVKGIDRIEVVDILRGFAIVGILLVNMYGFAGMQLNPQSYTGLDRIVVILVLLFAQAKFYSLFSFLFGWGMWIQMSRAISKGINFVPLYLRRMLILLVIGILHGIFIWTGDILTVYAVLGMLLILFRNSSERILKITIALLLLIPIIINLPGATMNGFRDWYAQITDFLRTFGPQDNGIYGYGTYREITEHRLQDFVGGQTWFIYWIGNVFSMFLLGFYAGKRGYFHNISENRLLFRRTQWIGLIVGLIFAGFSVYVTVNPDIVGPEWQRWVRIATRTIGAPALMLFYVSTITLLSQREQWKARLAPLAPVGRMALTNYLLQSLILTLIFYGYGLALYDEIGPTVGLFLTFIVYAAQIRFSAWWLERYRFGPMEWLWRTLTYGRVQRIRRGPSSSEPRKIPGISRVRRLLSAVPPLVFLAIIWIGLTAWAIGLFQWNQKLTSEIFVDPFREVINSGGDLHQEQSTAQDSVEVGNRESDSVSEAILPDVRPVDFNPGAIVSSGDMLALAETFDVSAALDHIGTLTSREYAGRLAGSDAGQDAGDYIAEMMADYGLQPGGVDGSFFQPFPLTYTLLVESPQLAITAPDGTRSEGYVLYEDYAPFISAYAGGGQASGEVHWANQCQPDDFQGLDVVGKVVICFAASTGSENTANSRRAMEYGADGLLLLVDPQLRPADFGYRHSEVWVPRSIPVLFVYADAVTDLFEGSGFTPDAAGDALEPFALDTQAEITVSASGAEVVEARNVLGILPGRNPSFRDEVVVVGAHYDHMGQSPDGTYWPGANDNASGVAVILEIARSWHEHGYVPRRTVVFAAWDAEEWGLIGSTVYVFNPSYPLENTIASIQMDMVGTGGDTLNIGGLNLLSGQLHDVAESLGIETQITDQGRSDHIPFMRAGIPASLLIWDYDDIETPSYHRPSDQLPVIEPDKLAAASRVAVVTLLDLVESEPAIRGMLIDRAKAALENDQDMFLSTSRQDQLVSDENWMTDLQSFEPTTIGMTVDNLKVNGGSAMGDVHIWVQYPDLNENEITRTISVDLPVQFTRVGSEWAWAGPSLIWAEEPESDSVSEDPALAVASPADMASDDDANFWLVGVEAARQYAENAAVLGLPVESESTIMLLPDAEAIRVSTALSLPSDKESWIGPGLVKLAYQQNISQTEAFSKAIAQLLLANAGVTEAAAPWLWHGLPAVLQADSDLVTIQFRHLPVLHNQLSLDEVTLNESSSWAAVDYMVETVGWDGLGRFINALGRACGQGNCQDSSGQDAALQRVLRLDSNSFAEAWQTHWRSRLDEIQRDLDQLLVTRADAVSERDEDSFINTTYQDEPALVSSDLNWFSELFRLPPDSFSLSAYPVALLPTGDVLAKVTMSFLLPGNGDESIELTILFKRDGQGYLWAGPSLETVSGPSISIRYPEGQDQLAFELLLEAESQYAQLSRQLGVESPEGVIIDLLRSEEEFRTTVALSFPAANWILGYSQDGTPIRLRMSPVSQADDYKSELAVQLARQLLYQQGVESEWLLKGIGAFLSRSLDGGANLQAVTASLPDLVDAVNDENLFDLREIPDDARTTKASFERARVQSWDTVRYLVEQYGWESLVELIIEHGSGAELDDAMRTVLGETASAFTEEWATSFAEGHMPDTAFAAVAEFDTNEASDHITYLTSPELEGRLAGTEGADAVAAYIAQYFEESRLQPAGNISGTTFLQTFSITSTAWVQEPYFEVIGDDQPFVPREEMLFSRAAITGTDIITGDLVWVGSEPVEEIDLSKSIMVVFASEFLEEQIEQAESLGAKGLLLLGIKDEIEELYVKKPLSTDSIAEIPVLELSKDGTLRFLELWGYTYMELSQLDDVIPLDLSARIGAKVENPRSAFTANVLGILPGSDPYLAQEYVIVGVHYDHVGDDPAAIVCTLGSSDSDQVCEERPGESYSGANDNASGVGVMLELIRLWEETSYEPKRSILFAAWGAQEYGQLGSQNYILTPTIPLSQTMAMVQLDGVGGGGGFNPGIQGNPYQDALLLHYAAAAGDQLGQKVTQTDRIAESDHMTFSQAGMPVLLVNWRLADENNLPDAYANGVSLERAALTGSLAAVIIMMLAQ